MSESKAEALVVVLVFACGFAFGAVLFAGGC